MIKIHTYFLTPPACLNMQSSLITMLFLLLSLHFFSFTKSQGDGRGVISSDPSYYFNLCSTSTCNNVSLSYPFSPPTFCHNPQLLPTCVDNQYLTLSSKLMVDSYRVVGNITNDSTGYAILVASDNIFGCGKVTWPNYFMDPNIFSLSGEYQYGTYLNCTQYPASAPPGSLQQCACLECDARSGGNTCLYTPGFVNYPECENFFIYSKVGTNVSEIKDLRGFVREGFQIKYTITAPCLGCGLSGGRCGSSPAGSFVCFCASSAHPSNCSDGTVIDLRTWIPPTGKSKLSKVVIAAICISAVALIAIATLVATFVINQRKLRRKQDGDKPQVDLEDLVNGISPTRYSSSQIKKFTSNFSTKLGEGGFGSVYKGVIQGVGPVAVKILKRSERNEKQFMNEVVTIGRVHHNNLVRLLGYCAQGKMRALVYEFMEKGSLDHYIYKSMKGITNQGNNITLTAQQMFNIALETAKGILYLHQGCRSRILHCDIKPHNVLLDSNFSAKVADFGLARMIDKDHSHVSLTNAQGTPGYAAPEMWTKTYGPITDKSDVYSYGMLLLEMVGGRDNNDSGKTESSHIYFPERVFRQVANGDLKLRGRVSDLREIIIDRKEGGEGEGEGDEVILEKMCLVGLWSIQHIPSNRPAMSKVIQMLEGKVEIETPPQPFPEESSEGTFTSYFTASSASIVQPNGKGEDNDKSSME